MQTSRKGPHLVVTFFYASCRVKTNKQTKNLSFVGGKASHTHTVWKIVTSNVAIFYSKDALHILVDFSV